MKKIKNVYWYIGIGVIAVIFFFVPLKEGVTLFQYLKDYTPAISLE